MEPVKSDAVQSAPTRYREQYSGIVSDILCSATKKCADFIGSIISENRFPASHRKAVFLSKTIIALRRKLQIRVIHRQLLTMRRMRPPLRAARRRKTRRSPDFHRSFFSPRGRGGRAGIKKPPHFKIFVSGHNSCLCGRATQ